MRLKLCAFVAALLLLLPFAQGQPGPTFVPCLETLTINSRSVLIAKIADVCASDSVPCGAGTNAIVDIERFLKGYAQSGKMQARIDAPVTVLTNWKARGNRLLLFYNVEGNWPASGERGYNAIDLSDCDLKVLTADMKILRDPDQVLRSVQSTIARHPNVYGIFTVRRSVPSDAIQALGKSGAMGVITEVPADSDLENWALSVLRAGSAPPGSVVGRQEAVDALQYFKSDKNVALLTSLLKDPTWAISQQAEYNMGVEVRWYVVRESAYNILHDWGIDVPKPVMQEEAQKPESVTLISISNKLDFVHHADLDVLSRFPNLQTIVLNNDRRMTDQAFRSLGMLKTLRNVSLAGSNVNDDRLKYLAGLNNLESLNLRGTKISDDGLRTISEFDALKVLDIAGTRVTPDAIADLRKTRPDLQIKTK